MEFYFTVVAFLRKKLGQEPRANSAARSGCARANERKLSSCAIVRHSELQASAVRSAVEQPAARSSAARDAASRISSFVNSRSPSFCGTISSGYSSSLSMQEMIALAKSNRENQRCANGVELGDFHERSACTGTTGCQIPDKSLEGVRRRDVSKVHRTIRRAHRPKEQARKYSERAASRQRQELTSTAPSGAVPRSTQSCSASSACSAWRSRERRPRPAHPPTRLHTRRSLDSGQEAT